MLQHAQRLVDGLGAEAGDVTLAAERPTGPGKKQIPRVSSMLFDLELEDQDSGELDSLVSSTQHGSALLKLLQPASQAEKQLGLAVNAAFEASALRGKPLTIDQLADSLRSQNYDVRIRTALGGGGNQECLRNLRHHFLTLNLTGADGRLTECIIDPSFAEQWGIARPTPAYAAIVDALPQVYVGSSVEPVVDYLCGELAKAFKAEGATLPPWRSSDAMLSKWRPRRSVDLDRLAPQPASAAAVSSAFSGGGINGRRSISVRPAKTQRLSSTGERRSSNSSTQSPSSRHQSPFGLAAAVPHASRGHSNLSSTPRRVAPSFLKKSASNALSDAEAEEEFARTSAPLHATAFADDAMAGDVDSDGSADSDAASFRRHSGNARRDRSSMLPRDSIDFSSSWRASDIVPFPQASVGHGGGAGGLVRQSSATASGRTSEASTVQKPDWPAAAVRQGGFGSTCQPGSFSGNMAGVVKNMLPRAARLRTSSLSEDRSAVSASDGSDTTQAPVATMPLCSRIAAAPLLKTSSALSDSFATAPSCAAPAHTSCPLPLPAPQPAESESDGTRTLSGPGIAARRHRSGESASAGSPKRAVHRVPLLEASGRDRKSRALFSARGGSSDEEGAAGAQTPCSCDPHRIEGLPSNAQAAVARSSLARQQLGLPPLPQPLAKFH